MSAPESYTAAQLAKLEGDRKALLTRIRTVANAERMTLEALAQRPDSDLLSLPNFGRRSIAVLREVTGIVAPQPYTAKEISGGLKKVERLVGSRVTDDMRQLFGELTQGVSARLMAIAQFEVGLQSNSRATLETAQGLIKLGNAIAGLERRMIALEQMYERSVEKPAAWNGSLGPPP